MTQYFAYTTQNFLPVALTSRRTMAADAAAAGIAGAMSGAKLGELMATEGPIVKVVILETDGSVVEQQVDMSPKVNKVSGVVRKSPPCCCTFERYTAPGVAVHPLSIVTITHC